MCVASWSRADQLETIGAVMVFSKTTKTNYKYRRQSVVDGETIVIFIYLCKRDDEMRCCSTQAVRIEL